MLSPINSALIAVCYGLVGICRDGTVGDKGGEIAVDFEKWEATTPRLPFLAKVDRKQLRGFFDIIQNKAMTKQEILDNIGKWADGIGGETAAGFKLFAKRLRAYRLEAGRNISRILNELPILYKRFQIIKNNMTLTGDEDTQQTLALFGEFDQRTVEVFTRVLEMNMPSSLIETPRKEATKPRRKSMQPAFLVAAAHPEVADKLRHEGARPDGAEAKEPVRVEPKEPVRSADSGAIQQGALPTSGNPPRASKASILRHAVQIPLDELGILAEHLEGEREKGRK